MKKETLIQRRWVAVVPLYGGRAIPSFYNLYECTYARDDGNVRVIYPKLEYGRVVRAYPSHEMLNAKRPSKKKKEQFRLECQLDMMPEIGAMTILQSKLKEAALALDKFHGIEEGYFNERGEKV